MIVSIRNVSYTYNMFEPIAIHLSERTNRQKRNFKEMHVLSLYKNMITLYKYRNDIRRQYAAQILLLCSSIYIQNVK